MPAATVRDAAPELTIGEARDRFSSLVADVASGAVPACVVKNRRKPVVRIVPYEQPEKPRRVFGIAKGSPFLPDEAAFDALDAEIAEEFGV